MKSIEHKHALSAQHRLMITDTEHFVSALVVGPQDHTTTLQTLPQHSCWLSRNTWYNTTSRVERENRI